MNIGDVKSAVKSIETDSYNTQKTSSATTSSPSSIGADSASGSVSAKWKPAFGSGGGKVKDNAA